MGNRYYPRGSTDPFDSRYPRIDGLDYEHLIPGALPPWEVERVPIGSVSIVPVVHDHAKSQTYVLLVCQAEPVYLQSWDYPAGGVEPYDGNPKRSAQRELYEETGLSPNTTRFHYLTSTIYTSNTTGGRTAGLHFLADLGQMQLSMTEIDDEGRIYREPFPGAFTDEISYLAFEPWDCFFSDRSLTRTSRYPALQVNVKRLLSFWYAPRYGKGISEESLSRTFIGR